MVDCPTCGQRVAETRGGDMVIATLAAKPERSLYTAHDGSFWVDHSGGRVPENVVKELIAAGRIVRKWADVEGCYVLPDAEES